MANATVFVIVEGQTENAFLKQLLASHFGERGIDFHVPIVKAAGGRGGVKFLNCADLCRQIQNFLRDPRRPFVTTFFDYYGFPSGTGKGWDFVAKAKATTGWDSEHICGKIEEELHSRALSTEDVAQFKDRVFPYLQLHELEALFFAEPEKMAETFEAPGLAEKFRKTVMECGSCEAINDTPQGAPSKRIQMLFRGYIKGRSTFAHGPRLAAKLSLDTVRNACPRFSAWVGKIETLADLL